MLDYIIIHYGEIALKGKNRPFFEKRLVSNIKRALKAVEYKTVKRISGRILVRLQSQTVNQSNSQMVAEASKRLRKVFGIENFSFARSCKQDLQEIQRAAWQILKDKDFVSFKVESKRSQKDFPLTSPEINEKLGDYILAAYADQGIKKKVDLEDPDLTLYVEIVEDYAFCSTEKITGPGGLPTGVSGKVVSLLSSGIDSPVAGWQMAKRGCEVVFAHFHSFPFTKRKSQENVKKLVKMLSLWQLRAKLYLVNIQEVQKEIIAKSPEKLRLLFYRRAMFKLAQDIAEKEGALGLVTGESVGQVASQTLENMRATSEAAALPIYRPNIGLDKQEIIRLAKRIGTYETSIRPAKDCCTYMVPEHPETKADLDKVLEIEKSFELDEPYQEALKKAEVVTFDN